MYKCEITFALTFLNHFSLCSADWKLFKATFKKRQPDLTIQKKKNTIYSSIIYTTQHNINIT